MKSKVLLILLPIIMLSTSVFATNSIKTNDDILTKTIVISESEESNFLELLEEKTTYQDKTYKLIGTDKEKLESIISKTGEQTKTLELNTNKASKILGKFSQSIVYDDGEFIGDLYLQEDSLNISTIRNGSYEQVITLEKEYPNLNKSDLDYIPKELVHNGYTYYLTNCEWEIIETENILDVTMPRTYMAKTLYKAVKTVEYPYTYKCTVKYIGEISKTTYEDIQYTLTYIEEQPEIIPEETKQLPILPIVGGTGLFIVVVFFLLPNAKITNYSNGKYTIVKRIRVSIKNPKVDLRHLPKATTNVFSIIFNEKTANKLQGKYVKILTPKNTIQKAIIKNSIEVNI